MNATRPLLALLLALLATPALAHEVGQARVRFALPADGPVTARVELARVDVLDLAGVDKAAPIDDAGVTALAAAGFPEWLAVFADGRPCPLTVTATAPLGLNGVAVDATAACPAPGPVTLEWRAATHPRLSLAAIGTVSTPTGEQPITFGRGSATVTVTAGATVSFPAFLWSGVEHILIGWDHLAFLLALLLSCGRLRRVLAVVTAFTVAHSVTLILGATGAIDLPAALVESIIAASIAVAAGYGLWQWRRGTLDHPGRATAPADAGLATLVAVCFAFGLVHGLGFAGLLAELLPGERVPIWPLVGFNLGVELGQIVCVAVAFPLLAALGRSERGRPVFGGLLAALVLLGAAVAVQRLL
ncbi:MAG: HupE/UreJ family protein [Myxococcales bacterium]|nr:HupE/UreJ family protein [Myxococcales bacterium]